MGRKIRRVPQHWEHPKKLVPNVRKGVMEERYQPLYDRCCEDAWEDWQQEFSKWREGEHKRIADEYGAKDYPLDQPYMSFCQWHGTPPSPEHYRPKWDEGTATWFQVYETVSEGTPVTPPFATKEELIDYLVANGDFWDQSRRKEGRSVLNCDPWSREQAEAFVNGPGWAPSFVIDNNGVPRRGVEALADQEHRR